MIASLAKANELIEQQQLQIEELSKKLCSSQRQIDTLQHQVEQLLRRIYGRRSEKFNPNQLTFDNILIQAIEQSAASQDHAQNLPESSVPPKQSSRRSKGRHLGRVPIPEHLERKEIILDIAEEQKVCSETGKPLKQIGCEVSEKLEYRPGRFIVNVY